MFLPHRQVQAPQYLVAIAVVHTHQCLRHPASHRPQVQVL